MKSKTTKIICYSLTSLLLPATSLVNACGEKYDLVIGNWADYIYGGDDGSSNLISQFENLTGYKVKYVSYETNENLATFFNQFDLAVPSDYYVERFQKEGKIVPIDWSKMHIWTSKNEPLPENSQVETYDKDKETVTKYDYKAGYSGYCKAVSAYDDDEDCWNSINNRYYTSLNGSRPPANSFDMLKWSIPYNVGTVGMFVNIDRFDDPETLLNWNDNPEDMPDWKTTFDWMTNHLKPGFLLGMTDDARNDYFVGANLHNSLFPNDQLSNLNNPLNLNDVTKAFDSLSQVVNLDNKWTLVKDNYAYEGVYDQNVLGNELGASFDYNGEAVNMITQYYNENPDEAKAHPDKYLYLIPNDSKMKPVRNIWTDNFVINKTSVKTKEKVIYEFLSFMSNFNSAYMNASYVGYNSGVLAVNENLVATLANSDIPDAKNQAIKSYNEILKADLKNFSSSTFRYLLPDLNDELITTWNKFYIFFRNG